MTIMGFALINSEIGAEQKVLGELKKIDGVTEVAELRGTYQIYARFHGEDMDNIKNTVHRIRKMDKVYTTSFLLVKEYNLKND